MDARRFRSAASVAAKIASYGAAGVIVALLSLNLIIPRLTETVPLTVLSGSMSPAIPAGSLVLVRPTDPNRLDVGDIITFETAPGTRHYVTHRIVAVGGEDGRPSFTTKGDANRGEDLAPVQGAAVRGRVWFQAPAVGALRNRLVSRNGTVTLLVFTLGVLVSSALRGRWARSHPAPPVVPDGTTTLVTEGRLESEMIVRQLLLAMVPRDSATWEEVSELARSFDGSVIAGEGQGVTLMVAGPPEALDRLEGLLVAWPGSETVRSTCVGVSPRLAEVNRSRR